jgi:hypothetical protein
LPSLRDRLREPRRAVAPRVKPCQLHPSFSPTKNAKSRLRERGAAEDQSEGRTETLSPAKVACVVCRSSGGGVLTEVHVYPTGSVAQMVTRSFSWTRGGWKRLGNERFGRRRERRTDKVWAQVRIPAPAVPSFALPKDPRADKRVFPTMQTTCPARIKSRRPPSGSHRHTGADHPCRCREPRPIIFHIY